MAKEQPHRRREVPPLQMLGEDQGQGAQKKASRHLNPSPARLISKKHGQKQQKQSHSSLRTHKTAHHRPNSNKHNRRNSRLRWCTSQRQLRRSRRHKMLALR